jgi:hypothetical protein
MRVRVYNNTGSPLPYGTAVKIRGTYIDPMSKNVFPLATPATAQDAGITSENIMFMAATANNGEYADAVDDEILVPFDTSALGNPGADVFLSNTGRPSATPGAFPFRVGEVVGRGTSGALLVATTTAGTKPEAVGGPETVTSGAVAPALRTSFLSVTGTQAYTLANGLFPGQRKTLRCTVAASTPSGVLTPATPKGFATVTFTHVNDGVELEWSQPGAPSTLGWYVVAVYGSPTVA